jgi:predicted metalloprotease with PDZ domain
MSTFLPRPSPFLAVLLAPTLLVIGPLAGIGSAQIDYRASLDPESELWTVEGRIANPEKAEVDFWIPRWTPGAYHLAEFGRWVEELQARDAQGKTLEFERIGESHFRIASQGVDPVLVRYTARSMSKTALPMNDMDQFVIDVEANRITSDYAYVNPPSLFGFVAGALDDPISLTMELPAGWSAATVLARDEAGVFHAPSYYRFEDSPLLFAPGLRSIELEAGGKPCTVTMYGQGAAPPETIAGGCKRIVESAAKLMGGLPYDRYHFLIAYVPGSGAGLEHSDSTLILASPEMSLEDQWGLIGHEFFHLWCAERIHTAAIHQPDFTEPLRTATIWVNESITDYFTQHVLLHAGLQDRAGLLAHFLEQSPMEAMFGSGGPKPALTQVSRDWEKIDGLPDLMNFIVRIYSEGPKTMFALDLAMRRASGGEKGVLDLLRHLMSEYAAKDRGFGEEEMPEILNGVAGADISDFYKRYIAGGETPELGSFLDVIGYRVEGGVVAEVPEPTAAQLDAREDFFSAEG